MLVNPLFLSLLDSDAGSPLLATIDPLLAHGGAHARLWPVTLAQAHPMSCGAKSGAIVVDVVCRRKQPRPRHVVDAMNSDKYERAGKDGEPQKEIIRE